MGEEVDNRQQELPELRSLHNRQSAFVKFVNVTDHSVGLYWIDYQGKEVGYKVLGCNEYIDINTFVTHPWIFVAEDTKDRYAKSFYSLTNFLIGKKTFLILILLIKKRENFMRKKEIQLYFLL